MGFFMKYSQPKGTFDILPRQLKLEDQWKLSPRWQFVESTIKDLCADYGFQEIRTPIFEMTDLFIRSAGDTSDIVSKEMYTFEDKGQRSLTLRPEGTAPVIRAFLENHLNQFGQNHKFFYIGPFFRYDRPQAGRYRQLHQFGIEVIGRSDPYLDAEIIDMLCQLYKRLGLSQLEVLINSVGDEETRVAYLTAFLKFLTPFFSELSPDSQQRFSKNPLRILDTKDPKEKEILKNAPQILNYLSSSARAHFDQVCSCLTHLGISYKIDPKLVRGLDYYNKTVFEITSTTLGAQNTIGAGGRYDGLIKKLGGPDLPSFGFGTGLERILLTMEKQDCKFPQPRSCYFFIIGLGETAHNLAFSITCNLRHKGISCELYIKTAKIQKALEEALDSGCEHALIIGENEISSGVCQLKNLKNRKSQDVSIPNLIVELTQIWNQKSAATID
jgi:histidyl-tRNA synthetase